VPDPSPAVGIAPGGEGKLFTSSCCSDVGEAFRTSKSNTWNHHAGAAADLFAGARADRRAGRQALPRVGLLRLLRESCRSWSASARRQREEIRQKLGEVSGGAPAQHGRRLRPRPCVKVGPPMITDLLPTSAWRTLGGIEALMGCGCGLRVQLPGSHARKIKLGRSGACRDPHAVKFLLDVGLGLPQLDRRNNPLRWRGPDAISLALNRSAPASPACSIVSMNKQQACTSGTTTACSLPVQNSRLWATH